MRNYWGTISSLFALIVCFQPLAFADQNPSAASKYILETIDKVRATVMKERGKISEEELDKKLIEVIAPVFDFAAMSRSSLGPNWKKATKDEQQEFTKLFSDLLSRTYLEKIKNIDHNEIDFKGETVKGGKTVVKTVVRDDTGDEIQVNYRVRSAANSYHVYDVIIGNVGLVTNYRNEFAGIIRKKEFTGLLQDLRDKKVASKPIES